MALKSLNKQLSQLKINYDWSFDGIGRAETSKFTHSYHRYPAKFIPQLVDKLIINYTKEGDLVCDPFGGCGTTLIEAKLHGRRSIGFDINPVAKFITKVKTTPIKPAQLIKARDQYRANIKNKLQVRYDYHPRLNYWFDKRTINKLDRIYQAIMKINEYRIRNFFLCSFSHILKNSSRWLMKSIKPTLDQDKSKINVYELFLRHLDHMIKKNELFYQELLDSGFLKIPSIMYRRDSTKRLSMSSNSIDLVITSPPYVTSYEYADLHQLTLLWLGDDKVNFKNWSKHISDFKQFRKEFIGTCYKDQRRGELNSKIANEIIDKLQPVSKRLANDVTNYFIDMNKAFGEIYRILKGGKIASIIIGNTSLKGVEILNAEVAAEQMINLGFTELDYIKRSVGNKMITPWRDKKSGKFTSTSNHNKKRAYEFEYVLIMQKDY